MQIQDFLIKNLQSRDGCLSDVTLLYTLYSWIKWLYKWYQLNSKPNPIQVPPPHSWILVREKVIVILRKEKFSYVFCILIYINIHYFWIEYEQDAKLFFFNCSISCLVTILDLVNDTTSRVFTFFRVFFPLFLVPVGGYNPAGYS